MIVESLVSSNAVNVKSSHSFKTEINLNELQRLEG